MLKKSPNNMDRKKMFAKPQPNRQTIQTNTDDVWETIEVYYRIVMIKKFP